MKKKVFSASLLLTAFVGAFALYFFLYHTQTQHNTVQKPYILTEKIKALPQRITIPAIGVNAAIQQVGITTLGAMDVPGNATDAGWYNLGPVPGASGSAVMVGHYDTVDGTKGIFANLHLLKPGEIISIEDSNKHQTVFIVRESRKYNPQADASEVFGQASGNHLNLITCDGKWDNSQKSYSERLVVFSDVLGSNK